jgi:hypothetical protein
VGQVQYAYDRNGGLAMLWRSPCQQISATAGGLRKSFLSYEEDFMPNPNKIFAICTNKRGEFLDYEVTDLR